MITTTKKDSKLDINAVKKQAQAEFLEETNAKAVAKYKTKLKELANAKLAVRNIEREIEDLEDELQS